MLQYTLSNIIIISCPVCTEKKEPEKKERKRWEEKYEIITRARRVVTLRVDKNVSKIKSLSEFIIHLINCYWVIIVKRIVDFSIFFFCSCLALNDGFTFSLLSVLYLSRLTSWNREWMRIRESSGKIKYPLYNK